MPRHLWFMSHQVAIFHARWMKMGHFDTFYFMLPACCCKDVAFDDARTRMPPTPPTADGHILARAQYSGLSPAMNSAGLSNAE